MKMKTAHMTGSRSLHKHIVMMTLWYYKGRVELAATIWLIERKGMSSREGNECVYCVPQSTPLGIIGLALEPGTVQ